MHVDAFLTRPIEGEWPYLWFDATYLKVCKGGRIASMAVTLAVGVNTDGRHEGPGMFIGATEAQPFWTELLRDLVRRGLSFVKLVTRGLYTRVPTGQFHVAFDPAPLQDLPRRERFEHRRQTHLAREPRWSSGETRSGHFVRFLVGIW